MISHEEKQAIVAQSLLGPSSEFAINLVEKSVERALEECKNFPEQVVMRRAFKNVRNTLKYFSKKKLYHMVFFPKKTNNPLNFYTKAELLDIAVKSRLAPIIQTHVRTEVAKRDSELSFQNYDHLLDEIWIK